MADADLPPDPLGVAGGVVALAGPAGLGLLLRPRAQGQHLGPHRPLGHVDQDALVVGTPSRMRCRQA